MRIIAGIWRGRPLAAPKGMGTRPTTDRVRESMMSSVGSLRGGFDGAVVLDAFSGSGALGLEALSRGAARAVLCDKDRRALEALQRNAAALNVGPKTSPAAIIRKGDVLQRPPAVRDNPYDLVFLDPPYAVPARDVLAFLDALWQEDSLTRDVLVVYEHASADDVAGIVAETAVSWAVAQTKRYGETAIDYLKRGAS